MVDAATREAPSSVEALRKQLDDTADWNRTAWIVLVAIAAVALVAAGAHRARELLRAPPPARRAADPAPQAALAALRQQAAGPPPARAQQTAVNGVAVA